MEFNLQVTIVIIIGLIMFFGLFWVAFISNADITVTYKIVMDNNTLEAIKSIDYDFFYNLTLSK